MRIWVMCALVLLTASAFGRGGIGGSAAPLAPRPQPTPSAAEEGQAVYVRVGCAGCHGEDARGGIGPALIGVAPQRIRSVVRNPPGLMPAFPPATLSDEDLEKIVAFLQRTGEEGSPTLPGWSTWISLIAIGAMALFMFLMMGRGGFGPRCMRRRMRSRRRRRPETPLEILRKRYARGEITREEFQKMKDDL